MARRALIWLIPLVIVGLALAAIAYLYFAPMPPLRPLDVGAGGG